MFRGGGQLGGCNGCHFVCVCVFWDHLSTDRCAALRLDASHWQKVAEKERTKVWRYRGGFRQSLENVWKWFVHSEENKQEMGLTDRCQERDEWKRERGTDWGRGQVDSVKRGAQTWGQADGERQRDWRREVRTSERIMKNINSILLHWWPVRFAQLKQHRWVSNEYTQDINAGKHTGTGVEAAQRWSVCKRRNLQLIHILFPAGFIGLMNKAYRQ